MQTAKVRLILSLVGGAAAVGAVASIVASVILPLGSLSDSGSQRSDAGISVHTSQGPATLPLASFERAWQMPLRRPLVDAPPPAIADNGPPSGIPAPSVRLVGTIVDGQHPRGIFMIGLTNCEMKTVGDTVGASKIVAIDDNSATLSSEAGTITLHREKKPFDPSGDSYNTAAPTSAPSDARDAPE